MTRPLPKSTMALDDDQLALLLLDRALQVEPSRFRDALLDRIRQERWWCQRCPNCMAYEGVRCDDEIPNGLKCKACNEVEEWPEVNDLADALQAMDREDRMEERHCQALLDAWWQAEEEKLALRDELTRIKSGSARKVVAYRVFDQSYTAVDTYVIETYLWDRRWQLFINGQEAGIFATQTQAELFALDITRPALQPSACKCGECAGRKVA